MVISGELCFIAVRFRCKSGPFWGVDVEFGEKCEWFGENKSAVEFSVKSCTLKCSF